MRQLATWLAWIAPVLALAPLGLAQCSGDDSSIAADAGKKGSGSSSGAPAAAEAPGAPAATTRAPWCLVPTVALAPSATGRPGRGAAKAARTEGRRALRPFPFRRAAHRATPGRSSATERRAPSIRVTRAATRRPTPARRRPAIRRTRAARPRRSRATRRATATAASAARPSSASGSRGRRSARRPRPRRARPRPRCILKARSRRAGPTANAARARTRARASGASLRCARIQ